MQKPRMIGRIMRGFVYVRDGTIRCAGYCPLIILAEGRWDGITRAAPGTL